MTEITQADRDAAENALFELRGFRIRIASDKHSMIQAFARHRMEERAAIVAWLEKENCRCDCAAIYDGECACGALDEYKTVPIERILLAIEAEEHLK